jgi:hypothetical protein
MRACARARSALCVGVCSPRPGNRECGEGHGRTRGSAFHPLMRSGHADICLRAASACPRCAHTRMDARVRFKRSQWPIAAGPIRSSAIRWPVAVVPAVAAAVFAFPSHRRRRSRCRSRCRCWPSLSVPLSTVLGIVLVVRFYSRLVITAFRSSRACLQLDAEARRSCHTPQHSRRRPHTLRQGRRSIGTYPCAGRSR